MATRAVVSRVESTLSTGGSLKEGLNLVSSQTGVSVAALKTAYHRSRAGHGGAHGNARLTADQEQVLVGVVQAFSLNNFPLTTTQIRAVVKRRWRMHVSQPWVTRWLQRNRRYLSLRACKALADKRAGPEALDGTKDFCGELERFLKKHSFTPSAVFNYDETRITQRGGKMVLKRAEAAEKSRANAVSTRKATVASLLTFVAASGSVFMSVNVFKSKSGGGEAAEENFCLHAAPRVTRRSWPRYYCWTPTGYLNSEAFLAVVDTFAADWAVRNPGIPALLFGDQLGVHRAPDIVEGALAKNIYLFSLPKNTSHITQPLDEAPFGGFKRLVAAGSEHGAIDGILSNEGTRSTPLEAAYRAEVRSFTPSVIVGAFRRCGLWPFNSKLMVDQVASALGMGATDESPRGQASAAAADVIQEATQRAQAGKGRTMSGAAVVKQGVLHDPASLVAQSQAIAAQKEAEESAKAARAEARAHNRAANRARAAQAAVVRATNLCAACSARTWRGGKAWLGCVCERLWICPGCNGSIQAGSVMDQHVKECAGSRKDESSSDEQSESDEDE